MVKVSEIKEMLHGSKIIDFGRSCNLLWFMLQNGTSNYFIHSQCWTRIITSGTVLTTSNDIFESAEKDVENFLWEKFGDSIYDHKLLNLQRFIGLTVEDIVMTDLGDIEVLLSHETRIQMMPSSSCGLEAWRIFEKNADYHFVYNGELQKE